MFTREPSVASTKGNARAFCTTHWSVVLRLGQGNAAEADQALANLCENYWYPLYAYVRGRGHEVAEAEDLVQGFFERMLERRFLTEADAARGRFRSFLLGCLNHYLANEWRRGQRMKRGAGLDFISLHDPDAEARLTAELATDASPERAYDRLWAVALLDRVMARLRAECAEAGRAERFELLQPFLVGARGDLPLAAAAAQLGFSLPAMKSTVHRMRQRYKELVREEIADTVERPEDIEEELRYLFAALGG